MLDDAYLVRGYGVLTALNELDNLDKKRGKKDLMFTAVGYGLQKAFPDAASWKDQAQRVRMYARSKLI